MAEKHRTAEDSAETGSEKQFLPIHPDEEHAPVSENRKGIIRESRAYPELHCITSSIFYFPERVCTGNFCRPGASPHGRSVSSSVPGDFPAMTPSQIGGMYHIDSGLMNHNHIGSGPTVFPLAGKHSSVLFMAGHRLQNTKDFLRTFFFPAESTHSKSCGSG